MFDTECLNFYAVSSLVEFISATIQTNVLFSVDATPAMVEVKMEVHIPDNI